MTKYISITLGPITRVISLAESTKELWAASYFFSYLAKQIITPFKDREFLLPAIDSKMWEPHNGAGLFPDRYIFKAEESDFEALQKQVNKVLSDVSCKIAGLVNANNADVETFLKGYLKVYFFEKSFNDNKSSKEIVEECEHTLNLIEMQDAFLPRIEDKKNYLSRLFKNVNGKFLKGRLEKSFLAEDAFDELESRLFESIIEISAADLKEKDIKKYLREGKDSYIDEKSVEDFEKEVLQSDIVRKYHKYIAIVTADGDSLGKTIAASKSSSDLSKALLDFAIDAADCIKNYKGKPVYIGGDDLLFFAPVRSGDRTIFDLIHKLDESFGNMMNNHNVAEPRPTMSYGVSISYYKYPMFEALENSRRLLDKAKQEPQKNSIAVAIQKHSGQMVTNVISKGCGSSYQKYLEMIKEYTHPLNGGGNDNEGNNFLSSVMHKLRESEEVFKLILSQDDRVSLLKNYFNNNFNEKVHDSYKGLFAEIQELMLESYNEYKGRKDAEKQTIEMVYSALRFIQFINKKNDDENE